jgi:hypothetical protein
MKGRPPLPELSRCILRLRLIVGPRPMPGPDWSRTEPFSLLPSALTCGCGDLKGQVQVQVQVLYALHPWTAKYSHWIREWHRGPAIAFSAKVVSDSSGQIVEQSSHLEYYVPF